MNLVLYGIVVKELPSELSQGEYRIVFRHVSNNWLNEEYFFCKIDKHLLRSVPFFYHPLAIFLYDLI